jgi:flagellar biosynthesis/type III secretory pathway protein FliH
VTLARGRVLRGGTADSARALRPIALGPSPPGASRRLDRSVVLAAERAAAVVAEAESRAAAILTDARARADAVTKQAETVGRSSGLAEFAAHAMRLREREVHADGAALDRTIDLARLVAERLLGHALAVAPAEVASLARGALAEARGAQRIRIHANPRDAEILARVTAEVDPGGRLQAVLPDDSLLPGDLRLETDIGVVDARLGPSIARLATRLREALRE